MIRRDLQTFGDGIIDEVWGPIEEEIGHMESDDDSIAVADEDVMNMFMVVVTNGMLFCLIFGLSATVNVKNLNRQLRNKFAVGTGIAMQFVIMPILGFSSVVALSPYGLTKAMGVTLLVVTTSPGGSYSNWWCSTFNADLALSVAMTSFSTILSIALLPANLMLYSYLAYGLGNQHGEEEAMSIIDAVDFETIFITLGIVMGAIITGLCAGYRWDTPRFHIAANRIGTACGIALILFSGFLSSGGSSGSSEGSETNFWSQPWSFYVGVASPCLIGVILSNLLARSLRLPRPECVAISIECAYQNVGIATSVAVTMYQSGAERVEAISVPLFYGAVEGLVILVYCIWAWKMGWTKAPKDEHFCKVVSKTYELEEDYVDDDGVEGSCSHYQENMHLEHIAQQQQSRRPLYQEQDLDPIEEGSVGSIASCVVEPMGIIATPPVTPPASTTAATNDSRKTASKQASLSWSLSSMFSALRERTVGTFTRTNTNFLSTSSHDKGPLKDSDRSDTEGDFKRVDRNRIVSEDYTAATTVTTSPPPSPTDCTHATTCQPTAPLSPPEMIGESSGHEETLVRRRSPLFSSIDCDGNPRGGENIPANDTVYPNQGGENIHTNNTVYPSHSHDTDDSDDPNFRMFEI